MWLILLSMILALGLHGIIAFPAAVVFGKAWEAIAWVFNLPTLSYWQAFFITWALFILLPSGYNYNETQSPKQRE